MPAISGQAQAIQDNLQAACCFDQCPPLAELQDNQFLAVMLWYLQHVTGTNLATISASAIKDASQTAWCELNMKTFCSIPPDKLKAMILYLVTNAA